VGTQIVFETHARTEDNEAGIATGWLPGLLSVAGREDAAALGRRRRDDRLSAVFSSDLGRALETASIAFARSEVPVLADWRLRECDYGSLNGAPTEEVLAHRSDYLDRPYPGGESWRTATQRVGRFLEDLPLRWGGARVLVIGHVATRLGLERFLVGRDLATLVSSPFVWQEGWEYSLEEPLPSSL
jgi:2,3-bisphosphoglycerate-dependent phosphoglycerate mutase